MRGLEGTFTGFSETWRREKWGRPQVSSWRVHFTFESRIISPLEMGILVVHPTTWELFRGISRVSPLTGMLVIVMSLSVIFLPAPRSVAATTTSIRSSVLSRTQAVELNARTNARTVRDHFMGRLPFMA